MRRKKNRIHTIMRLSLNRNWEVLNFYNLISIGIYSHYVRASCHICIFVDMDVYVNAISKSYCYTMHAGHSAMILTLALTSATVSHCHPHTHTLTIHTNRTDKAIDAAHLSMPRRISLRSSIVRREPSEWLTVDCAFDTSYILNRVHTIQCYLGNKTVCARLCVVGSALQVIPHIFFSLNRCSWKPVCWISIWTSLTLSLAVSLK